MSIRSFFRVGSKDSIHVTRYKLVTKGVSLTRYKMVHMPWMLTVGTTMSDLITRSHRKSREYGAYKGRHDAVLGLFYKIMSFEH